MPTPEPQPPFFSAGGMTRVPAVDAPTVLAWVASAQASRVSPGRAAAAATVGSRIASEPSPTARAVLPLEPKAGDVALQEAKVWLHETAESDVRRGGAGIPRVHGGALLPWRGAAVRTLISPQTTRSRGRPGACLSLHAQGLGGHSES